MKENIERKEQVKREREKDEEIWKHRNMKDQATEALLVHTEAACLNNKMLKHSLIACTGFTYVREYWTRCSRDKVATNTVFESVDRFRTYHLHRKVVPLVNYSFRKEKKTSDTSAATQLKKYPFISSSQVRLELK